MLIYTGKSLSDNQVNKALKGEEIALPKGAEINIERGNKFITLCKAAKMDVSIITNRYFIRGFNNRADRIGEEKAFMALDKLKYMELTDEKLKQVKDEADFKIMLDEALKA